VTNFGFWFGDNRFSEPAFYAYTAPEPPGLAAEPLRPAAAWPAGTSSGWPPRAGSPTPPFAGTGTDLDPLRPTTFQDVAD
jgi:hypothetical protein